jgi:hypothetical protein
MKTFRTLMLAGMLAALGLAVVDAQVPGGLWRFGTTGAFAPQVGNCVSILAMNSSGQTGTDSATPCSPAVITTAYTNATTGFTAIMALPTTAAATALKGVCDLYWSDSNTSGTAEFGAGLSATPTDLWVESASSIGAYSVPVYTVITSTSTTAVTGALAAASTAATYYTHLSFTLQNSATAANTLTIYAESNNASYTLTVAAGSSCAWVP